MSVATEKYLHYAIRDSSHYSLCNLTTFSQTQTGAAVPLRHQGNFYFFLLQGRKSAEQPNTHVLHITDMQSDMAGDLKGTLARDFGLLFFFS
jgi:hypothetical protein